MTANANPTPPPPSRIGTEQLARLAVRAPGGAAAPDTPPDADPGISAPPTPDRLSQVSALLRGETPPGAVPAAPSPEGGADLSHEGGSPSVGLEDKGTNGDKAPTLPGVPGSLDVLAEALGTDVANLYQVKIPTRDGEQITLGELKDYHAARGDHEVERLEWEERRVAEQGELARTRQELAELLSAIPRDKLNPQVIERVRQVHETRMATERARLIDRVAEWKDDERRLAEMDKIAAHLGDYGIPKSALADITDHRLLVYMRDNMLRKARLDAALAQVREVRTPPPPGSGKPPVMKSGSSRQGQNNGPHARTRTLGEISKLLRGE